MNDPHTYVIWAGRASASPVFTIRLSREHESHESARAVMARLRRAHPQYQFTVRSARLSDRISEMLARESVFRSPSQV